MPEATVTIEGKDYQVDVTDLKLPEGFSVMSQDALRTQYVERDKVDAEYVPKAGVEETIKKRFAGWVKREDAVNDPEIVSKVVAANKGKEVDLEAERKRWDSEVLDPWKTRAESLESRAKAAAINEAARKAGVAEQHTKPIKPGSPSYMEVVYGDNFEYDPTLKDFVAVRDGHRMGAIDPGQSGRQYANAEEFFSREAKSDGMKPFLAAPEKNDVGPGYGRPDPGATSSTKKELTQMNRQERLQYHLKAHGSEGKA